MLYDQAIQKLKLNTDEYIRNVEDIPETPATMKAHIQKLMPNIPIGEGPITNIKLQINGEYIVEKHNQFIATILHEDIGNIYFTGRS